MRSLATVLVTLGAIVAGVGAAVAADPMHVELDRDYGVDGVADFPETAAGFAFLVDGRVDHAGRVVALVQRYLEVGATPVPYLERRTASGAPDGTFGAGGAAPLPDVTRWTTLAVDSQDRTVVVGDDRDGPAVHFARVDAAGALDASFGDGGLSAAIPLALTSWAEMRIDASGRIVVAAQRAGDGPAGWDVVRVGADGALDPEFGEGGRTSVLNDLLVDTPRLAIDASDRIVLAGIRRTPPGMVGLLGDPAPLAVVRLLPDGTPDRAFGDGGFALVEAAPARDVRRVMTDQEGRVLVLADRIARNGVAHETLLRLGADGALDLTWGRDRDGFADLPTGFDATGLVPSGDGWVVHATTSHDRSSHFSVSARDGSVFAERDAFVPFDRDSRVRRVLDADSHAVFMAGFRSFLGSAYYVARIQGGLAYAGSDLEIAWKSQPRRQGRSVLGAFVVRSRGPNATRRGTVTLAAHRVYAAPIVLTGTVPPMKPGREKFFRLRLRVRGGDEFSSTGWIATVLDPSSNNMAPNDVVQSALVPPRPERVR